MAFGCHSFKRWGGQVGRGVGAPVPPESDPTNHQRQHSGMSGGIPEPSALCPMNPAGPGAGTRAWRVEAGITPRSLGGTGPWVGNGHLLPPPESSTSLAPWAAVHGHPPQDSRSLGRPSTPGREAWASSGAASILSQGSGDRLACGLSSAFPAIVQSRVGSGSCDPQEGLAVLGRGPAGEGLGTYILSESPAGVIWARTVAGAEEPGL